MLLLLTVITQAGVTEFVIENRETPTLEGMRFDFVAKQRYASLDLTWNW